MAGDTPVEAGKVRITATGRWPIENRFKRKKPAGVPTGR